MKAEFIKEAQEKLYARGRLVVDIKQACATQAKDDADLPHKCNGMRLKIEACGHSANGVSVHAARMVLRLVIFEMREQLATLDAWFKEQGIELPCDS